MVMPASGPSPLKLAPQLAPASVMYGTVQNSKCCFWCRLQRNAPFISLLSWTEVGLKLMEMSDSKVVEGLFE
jgi:hypothetical protein